MIYWLCKLLKSLIVNFRCCQYISDRPRCISFQFQLNTEIQKFWKTFAQFILTMVLRNILHFVGVLHLLFIPVSMTSSVRINDADFDESDHLLYNSVDNDVTQHNAAKELWMKLLIGKRSEPISIAVAGAKTPFLAMVCQGMCMGCWEHLSTAEELVCEMECMQGKRGSRVERCLWMILLSQKTSADIWSNFVKNMRFYS